MDERPDTDSLIDAYLDGELSGAGLEAFEARLRSDPALRDEVERLTRIQAGVRRIHAPPDAPELPGEAPPAGQGLSLRRIGAYAALVALVAGAWFFSQQMTSSVNTRDAATIYAAATREFVPEVVCDTPEKFASYTVEVFGVAMAADFGAGVELIGWVSSGYSIDEDGPRSSTLLARGPGGEQVIAVFRERGAPEPKLDGQSALRMHAGTVGGVRVHEISPLDAPVVIPLISRAD